MKELVSCAAVVFTSRILSLLLSGTFFNGGTPGILLPFFYFSCSGDEDRLYDCRRWSFEPQCRQPQGVVCQGNYVGSPCVNRTLRLARNRVSLRYEGVVEICENNSWGTICADFWDTNDTMVVCRQLRNSGTSTSSLKFLAPTSIIACGKFMLYVATHSFSQVPIECVQQGIVFCHFM